jgi:carboxyl-terminal processing protease
MFFSFLLSYFLLASSPDQGINMLQVKEVISQNYYKELPDSIKKLPWNEYKKHLDKYTRILDNKEAEDFERRFNNKLEGVVGVFIDSSANGFYIEEVMQDGSAYREGIIRGDIIEKINNKKPINQSDIKLLMQGRIGTKVKLDVLRGNKKYEYNLERNIIETPSVISEKLDNTAIIQIESFNDNVDFQFYLNSVALDPNTIDTLIIDLQYNGGGLLYKCLRITEDFFTKDNLMLTRVSRYDTAFDFTTKDRGMWSNIKTIIILQNKFTASASELMTAVLKYGKNAIVVGDTSYGKGLVQSQFEVQGGRVFVTSQEYFPLGKIKINEIGVIPDKSLEPIIYDDFIADFDMKKFREDYPHPSLQALNDKRLKGRTNISHLLWEKEGELFEILLQKPYK